MTVVGNLTKHLIVNKEEGWLLEYENRYQSDPDYVAEGLALQVTENAAKIMGRRHISRSDLASRLGVSRTYVTKVFNAPPNMTLRTVAQLAIALDAKPYIGLTPRSSDNPVDRPVTPNTLTRYGPSSTVSGSVYNPVWALSAQDIAADVDPFRDASIQIRRTSHTPGALVPALV